MKVKIFERSGEPGRLEREFNDFLATLGPGAVLNTQTAIAAVRNENEQIETEHARHRRQVADVSVDDAEQRDDRGLVVVYFPACRTAHGDRGATGADASAKMVIYL